MRDKKVAILESRLGRQMVELVARQGGVPIHAPALGEKLESLSSTAGSSQPVRVRKGS